MLFIILISYLLLLVLILGEIYDDKYESYKNLFEIINSRNLSVSEVHELLKPTYNLGSLLDSIKGKHIVMIGDSLMRYQYISLVNIITIYENSSAVDLLKFVSTHNSFNGEVIEERSICNHHGWGNVNDFDYKTNEIFQPYEKCDCFPTDTPATTSENRYYRNTEKGYFVTFIALLGGVSDSTVGRWYFSSDESSYPMPIDIDASHFDVLNAKYPIIWSYNLKDFFEFYLPTLDPKPSVILLNAGFWPHKFSQKQHTDDIFIPILEKYDHVIWKTTSYCSDGFPWGHFDIDPWKTYYSNLKYLNISWTVNIPSHYFIDYMHYKKCKMYNLINMQFLEYLDYLFH